MNNREINMLHLNVAGIRDRFYDILFDNIRRKSDFFQDVYIAFKQNEYEQEEILRLQKYHDRVNPILSPIKTNTDRIMYHRKINKYYADLKHKTKIEKYEIVHAHSLFSDGGVAYKIYEKYQIPYIVSVRITDIDIFLKYFIHLKSYMETILTNASYIIFLSPSLKKRLLKKIKSEKLINLIEAKSTVLPNAISDFWHNNMLFRYPYQKQSFHLIQVGKLTKGKNTKTTLQTVYKLKDRGFDVHLDIVGTGPERKKLEDLVKKLEIAENVKFYGFIDDIKELQELYRRADFFVLPSYFETFGIVYVEAMSQGLPVIYAKNQGIDGYFADGEVGYAIDPFSSSEICDSIIKISNEYDDISKRCTKLASRFNWVDITEEYLALYDVYKKGR